jgi:hypothetical protein
VLLGSLLLLALIPQVVENLVRFWTWVLGLSRMRHHAYGHEVTAPTGGYLQLMFSRLPSHITIAVVTGLVLLVLQHRRHRWRLKDAPLEETHDELSRQRQTTDDLLLIVCYCLALGFLLSASPKQTFRYLMPAATGLYLIVGWALELFPLTRFIALGLVALQLVSLSSAYPYYNLYYSGISGGLAAAENRPGALALAGQREIINTLFADKPKVELRVAVLADDQTLLELIRKEHPAYAKRVRFVYSEEFIGEDFLIAAPASFALVERKRDRLELIKSVQHHGIDVMRLYKVLPYNFDLPERFLMTKKTKSTGHNVALEDLELSGPGLPSPVPKAAQQTADPTKRKRKKRKDSERAAVVLLPQMHPKGHVGGTALNLEAGNYRFKLLAARMPSDIASATTEDRLAFKMELRRQCERVVHASELKVGELVSVDMDCSIETPGRRQFQVYWFGNVPAVVYSVEVKRAS